MQLLPAKKSAGRKRRAVILRYVLALLTLAVIWVGYMQWRMATFDDRPAEPHDTGIVLGAALWNNEPSPALRERLTRALELYESGMISSIIVSGGHGGRASELTEAEGMRNYLVRHGVPEEAIVLENRAGNTYENILFSKALMEERGFRTAVIITHRYHTVRAMDIARFLGMKASASPMDSKVLMMAWHQGRETLALIKWQWNKLQLGMARLNDPALK